MPQLKITLTRSPIGYEKSQRATAEALGLRRLNQTVVQEDSPSIRGMVFKISHLVAIESAGQEAAVAAENNQQ